MILLWLNLLFSFTSYLVSSLNVDVTNPVIISDHFDGSDSLFGASVALFEREDKSSTGSPGWVVIGSPKANSTNHRTIYEPGVIWRCSLGRQNEDFCQPLVMDPTENKFFKQPDDRGDIYDRKDGGFLGSVLLSSNSENSRFVSCANRWQNQLLAIQSNFTQHYMMNGMCTWRPTNDIKSEPALPDLPEKYRILPLRNMFSQAKETEFIWAFGQAGFSGHLTDDNQMILGAPGMNAWKGGVIHFSDKVPASLRRNGQPDPHGGFFEIVFVSRSESNPELNSNNSYMGYAVTSGKFVRPTEGQAQSRTQFAAGIPRGNDLQGKVVIFTFPKRGSHLDIMQEIRGTKIGSYFGSVLCSVDVNNDGFDDLLIGAPQYTSKLSPKIAQFRAEPEPEGILQSAALFKPSDYGDEGRVFVYLSKGAELSKASEISGGNAFGSRFGSAIASIGDINNDGFNDIAIGAPYENEDAGAVYIYFGSSDGVATKAAQIIQASNLHSNLQGFGYSISLGVDIDNNGYNDLAVGSYISGQTVILRTRPIVNVVGKVTTTIDKLPLNATSFQVEACVSYTGKHAPAKLDISMKLTMDVDSRPPRVVIRTSGANGSVSIELNFRNVKYNNPSCESLTAVVPQTLAVTGNPITIKSDVWLSQNKKVVSPTIYEITASSSGFPNLKQSGPKYDAFCADCPVQDSESITRPVYFDVPLELPCGSDNKCHSDLRLTAAFADASSGEGFVIGSSPSLTLEISMENLGEAALSPALRISWKKINLLKVPPNCEMLYSGFTDVAYICKFGDLLAENAVAKLSLVFDVRDLYANEYDNQFECTILAKTSSEMLRPAQLNLAIPLIFEGDIFVTSKHTTILLNAEPEQGKIVNPYQFFPQAFQVGLTGESSVETVKLNFLIPTMLTSNLDEPIVEITNLRATLNEEVLICTRSSGEITREDQQEQLKTDSDSETVEFATEDHELIPMRSKREIGDSKSAKQSSPEDFNSPMKLAKDGVLTMSCSSSFVKCEEFTCEINKLRPGNQANIDFTLKISSESTRKLLKEQSAEALHIQSTGKAKMNIYSTYEPPIGHKPDEADAITKIELNLANVPKWVYMASASGGFICLALLLFAFYACGCFDRKKPEEIPEKEEEGKPLQSQTIPEEDESELEPDEEGNFSRAETVSPVEDPPPNYSFDRR